MQLVGDGDGVGRLALGGQLGDGLEDVRVLGLEEVAGGDPRLERCGDGVLAQQHRSEQRPLGVEVVGHDPVPQGRPREALGALTSR